jgi:putative ABC transport system substrate-binding protein
MRVHFSPAADSTNGGLGTQRPRHRLSGRRMWLLGVATLAVATPSQLSAQTQERIRRIGYLATSDPATSPQVAVLRTALQDAGYVEGKNLTIEYRWAEGSLERRPELAADLVASKVELIFAYGTPAVIAAKRATSTIPIVMVGVGDPVGSGLVTSLDRPGANVTGVSILAAELTAKMVELLPQILPGIRRVAVLRNPANLVTERHMVYAGSAASTLGLQLQAFDVRAPEDFAHAYADMAKLNAGAVVILGDPMFTGNSRRLAQLAIEARIPSIHNSRIYPEAGGLMSYGPALSDVWRLAARYVDRILKGARPADMPVEQTATFEFIINLQAARSLGLVLPNTVLERANRLIE